MTRPPEFESRLAAADTPRERLSALNDYARALTRAGDAQRALPLAREARRIASECGDDEALSEALCNLGMAHFLQAQYAQGLEDCMAALVIAERSELPNAAANALTTAAGCQYQMGAREEALQGLYQALEMIEAMPNQHVSVRVHNALGVILADKRRFEEAEDHYRIALDLGAAVNDVVYLARVKMNYASLHLERGGILEAAGAQSDARTQYDAGLQLCEELLVGPGLDSLFNKAHCVGTMGEIHCKRGEHALALQLFECMLDLGTQMGNPHQQADALLNLGKTHMMLGRSTEAKNCLDRAVHLASGANVRRLLTESFLSLAQWFEESGDLAQALRYQKRFHDLREELLREELHASGRAHEIWLRFQSTRRELGGYRQRAESLARANGALTERIDTLMRAVNEDALTGLSNRRHLDIRLAELVDATREGATRLSVALIDVDNFKTINDGHSHAVGDAVLQAMASMIRTHCREGDISARYGGDEFLVAFPSVDQEAAVAVLERLRSRVAEYDWSALHAGLRVTLSVGVAQAVREDSVDALMKRADAALYQAKRNGRDRIVGAPPPEAAHVLH